MEGFRIIGKVRLTATHPSLAGQILVGRAFEEAVAESLVKVIFVQHNLVLDQGMEAIAKFLGNNAGAPTVGGSTFADIEDLTIGSMEIGAAVAPADPVNGDTTSVSDLVYTPPITVSYPTSTSVMFSGVIPPTELIGTTLTEEALIMSGGKVFAKAVFSYLKTGAAGVQFDHVISFARS